MTGSLAIVKIGAMFVNSIEMHDIGEKVEKGMEMAYFTFGSTVVLIFEQGLFETAPSIHSTYVRFMLVSASVL